MISIDDDDQDFNLNQNTNLSNVFDEDAGPLSEKSKSFLFYKPKQNRKTTDNEVPQSNSSTSSDKRFKTYCAAAVDVYKLENGKYNYVSKLGIALVGNDDQPIYQLILYSGNNKFVCKSTLTYKFQFVCQANNYSSFYDDNRINWSILFSSQDSQHLFCRYIAHFRFILLMNQKNVTDNFSNLIQQDIGLNLNEAIPLLTDNHVISFRIISPNLYETNVYAKPYFPISVLNKFKNIEIIDKRINGSTSILSKILSNMSIGGRRFILFSFPYDEFFKELFPDGKFLEDVELSKYEGCSFEFELINLKIYEETIKTDNKCEILNVQTDETIHPVPRSRKSLTGSDLAARMAKIGALPIFPTTSNTNTAPEADTSVKTVEKGQPEPSEEIKSQTIVSIDKRISLIHTDLLELKSMVLSKPKPESNLTMDSTILLNTIQKIIEENGQLKIDLTNKNEELKQLNMKIIGIVEETQKSSPKEESPTNKTEVDELRDEIMKLKDQISSLRDEKYNLSMENVQLGKRLLESEKETVEIKNRLLLSSRQMKTILKQVLKMIYHEFNQSITGPDLNEETLNSTTTLSLLGQVLIRVKKQQELNIMEGIDNNVGATIETPTTTLTPLNHVED